MRVLGGYKRIHFREHMRVAHHFAVAAPDEAVWGALMDVPAVVACIPGARVTGRRDDGRYDASIGVRYGRIGLEFKGVADVSYDSGSRVVRIRANGSDRAGVTRAVAALLLGLAPRADGTDVSLGGDVELSGGLAHVPAVGGDALLQRLMTSFGERLAARIEGRAT